MERNPKKPVEIKDPLRGLNPAERERAEQSAAKVHSDVSQAEQKAQQQSENPDVQHKTDEPPKLVVHPHKDDGKHGHSHGAKRH